MNKASVMTLRLPVELKQKIESLADRQGVSINQMAMYMFAKEIGAIESGAEIAQIWAGRSRDQIETAFDKAISKVKKRKVPDWDKLD